MSECIDVHTRVTVIFYACQFMYKYLFTGDYTNANAKQIDGSESLGPLPLITQDITLNISTTCPKVHNFDHYA